MEREDDKETERKKGTGKNGLRVTRVDGGRMVSVLSSVPDSSVGLRK